jgi:hypothetical protein
MITSDSNFARSESDVGEIRDLGESLGILRWSFARIRGYSRVKKRVINETRTMRSGQFARYLKSCIVSQMLFTCSLRTTYLSLKHCEKSTPSHMTSQVIRSISEGLHLIPRSDREKSSPRFPAPNFRRRYGCRGTLPGRSVTSTRF